MGGNEEYQYQSQLKDMELSLQEERAKNIQNFQAATSNFQGSESDNLVEYQLGMDDILERIDHLIRGQIIKFKDGEPYWDEPEDKTIKIFSELGSQEMLRILSMYLNRNTILSNYDEETIQRRVYDIGYELTDLIHNKYEDILYTTSYEEYATTEFGYKKEDTISLKDHREILRMKDEELKEKLKNFRIVVTILTDSIESAYLRALHGGERLSLRRQVMVNQSLTPGMGVPMNQYPKKKFQLGSPTTWLGR